ncbi:kinetochore protein Spc24 [Dunckerocampus dactyliophorus]|uniref:kinetochore protein Spc24 n=1 Tax=Dunckerocampus dactyliophorus TaxID=161453 RepID=UPI002406D282|nr:kinetochore protein Spc24 [Dunckerocampus dactyliophorus]
MDTSAPSCTAGGASNTFGCPTSARQQRRKVAGSDFEPRKAAARVTKMSEGDKFQDFEETLEALVAVSSSQADKLEQVKNELQTFFDQHVEIKRIMTQILKDVAQEEEKVGQRLIDMEEGKKLREEELDSLEEQLRRCTAKSQTMDSELQFLQSELERLRSSEEELNTLRNEVDEDTTEVIPSAIYVAKLFHVITKIKWEYDTEPHILKGVHYGPDLATPIYFDTSAVSRSDVSDKLWNFVSAEW